jgi:tripartite-type tricarboxylate transporter receptor subunit TctC
MKRHPIAAGTLVLGLAAAGPAAADPVADFYKGRDVTILVAFSAGGGYGLYARTLAQHLSKQIPGKPTIITQFMPGAGGAKAANYFYNVSPRDGSVISLLSNSAALAQVLQGDKLKYDTSKLNHIGRMVDMRSAIIVWHTAPVKALEDARKETIIFGSTGKSSQDYMNPILMKNVLGYNVKMVMGYKGSKPINLAMEIGEVHAMANSWGSVKARLGHWLKNKQINVIAMVGLTRAPDLAGTPTLLELAKTEQDRAVMELMASTTAVGRAFATPPAVPADRVAALRAAFKATMEDPAFLADARKRKMDLEYMSGEEVQKIVNKTIAAPKSVVERFKKAL